MKEEMAVALDFGSSKIFGIAGLKRNERIEILGSHHLVPEQEIIQNGKVIDLEGVTQYTTRMLEELEGQVGKPLQVVNIGIGGGFIKGWLASKTLSLSEKKISAVDIETLLKQIEKDITAGPGWRALNLLSQEYIIDGETNVRKNPEGMYGNSVEAKVHILLAMTNPLQNFIQCIKNAGSVVDGIFPHSWACAELFLSDEEKHLGALVVDFGKGTTDFLLYVAGNLAGTYSLPLGSGLIDSDISQILNTPANFAEYLKKTAWCNYDLLKEKKDSVLETKIKIPSISGKVRDEIPAGRISEIVYERAMELFGTFIRNRLEKEHRFSARTGAGVVLTGGAAALKGLVKLNETIFAKPVRLGVPRNLMNLPKQYRLPDFSSGIGALLLALKEKREPEPDSKFAKTLSSFKDRISNIWNRW